MEKYITEELPSLLNKSDLPLDTSKASVFGHSMGGHGALTLYLKYPNLFKSSSAFAPICNPVNAPWGKKAFSGPNGNDGYLAGGMEEGKKHDATELLAGKKGENVNILVDSALATTSTRKANSCLKTSRKQPKQLGLERIKSKST